MAEVMELFLKTRVLHSFYPSHPTNIASDAIDLLGAPSLWMTTTNPSQFSWHANL
jgi:hypothetical protein